MATIRISEADAARDFAGLMARVRGGEIVIEMERYLWRDAYARSVATLDIRMHRAGQQA